MDPVKRDADNFLAGLDKTVLQSVWVLAGLGWLVYFVFGGGAISMAGGLTIAAVMLSIVLFIGRRNGL